MAYACAGGRELFLEVDIAFGLEKRRSELIFWDGLDCQRGFGCALPRMFVNVLQCCPPVAIPVMVGSGSWPDSLLIPCSPNSRAAIPPYKSSNGATNGR